MDLTEQTPSNDVHQIMEEFKTQIKNVPVNQRGKALAIFNILQKYVNLDDCGHAESREIDQVQLGKEAAHASEADQIINGERKANESELETLKEFLGENETPTEEDNVQASLEEFWLRCLRNKGLEIEEQDEPILKNLIRVERFREYIKSQGKFLEPTNVPNLISIIKNIQTTANEAKPETAPKLEKPLAKLTSTKTLKFYFSENEFFDNEVLTVVLYYAGDMYGQIISEQPNWKEGKNPGMVKTIKKQKNKKTGKMRQTESVQKMPTFFELFNNYRLEDEEGEEDDIDGLPHIVVAGDNFDCIYEMLPKALISFLDVEADKSGDLDDEDDSADLEKIEEGAEGDEDFEDDSEDKKP